MNTLSIVLIVAWSLILTATATYFMPTYDGMLLDALMYFSLSSIIPFFLYVVE